MRILNIITHPGRSLYYLGLRIRQMTEVKKVTKDGKTYFKYKGELFPDYLLGGNAVRYIKDKSLHYCQGKGIDVGADQWPLENATPVRNEPHQNAYKLDTFEDNTLDFVHSSHCLEHLEDWQKALKLWIQKLKPGGILFLYLPHEAMLLWNPGSPWVGKGHVWQPTHEVLVPFVQEHGMEIVEVNEGYDDYYSFHLVARKN